MKILQKLALVIAIQAMLTFFANELCAPQPECSLRSESRSRDCRYSNGGKLA